MTDGSVVYSEGAYADNVIVRKCLGQCVASAEQEDGADIPGITAASLSDIWVQPQRK
jgi:hypothetical protein